MLAETLIERIVRYVKFDTQSSSKSKEFPSTPGQKVLSRHLAEELLSLGASIVYNDVTGYVYGKFEGTIKEAPAVGFVAHVDTSEDAPGSNVKPIVHRDYTCGDIVLPCGIIIPSSELTSFIDDTLITSDGTTLLGGDDKAGIAVIMTAMERLMQNTFPRGDVYVMFNPDEEIGKGMAHFKKENFPVCAAYTLDGTGHDELRFESFNAAKANVTCHGNSIHPGYGHGKLINALYIANRFANQLPADRPETTKDKEGYYFALDLNGNYGQAKMTVLLRDFDKEGLERRKQVVQDIAQKINEQDGRESVTLTIEDQYGNMSDAITAKPRILEIVREAMNAVGITPATSPIRGGTDGCALSLNYGIPTPNIATGQHLIHSLREFVSVRDMAFAVDVVSSVVQKYSHERW